MQFARVLGAATATVKHSSMDGWRLLVVLPLDIDDKPDGFPALAIDNLGARCGDLVFFTSDGNVVRELVGQNDCPVRFAVQGIMDA